MSIGINLEPILIRHRIDSLRSSIGAMETSFSSEIEGENDLDMVTAFNEIKQEYEELLSTISSLFLENVQSADNAVKSMEETDQRLSNLIKIE